MKYSQSHLPTTAEIEAELLARRGDEDATREYIKDVIGIAHKVASNQMLDFEIDAQEQMDRDTRQQPIDLSLLDYVSIPAPHTIKDADGKVLVEAGTRISLKEFKTLEEGQIDKSVKDPAIRRMYERRIRESSSSRGLSVWAYNGLMDIVYMSGAHMVADATIQSGNVTLNLDASAEGYKESFEPVRKALGDIVNIIIDDLTHGKASYLRITEKDLLPTVTLMMLKQHESLQGLKDHFQDVLDYMNSPLISHIQERLKRGFLDSYVDQESILQSVARDEGLMKTLGYSDKEQYQSDIEGFSEVLKVSNSLSTVLSAQVLYHKRPANPVRFTQMHNTLLNTRKAKLDPEARMQFMPGDINAYRKSLSTAKWLHTDVYKDSPAHSYGMFAMEAAAVYNKFGEIRQEDQPAQRLSQFQQELLAEHANIAAAVEPLALSVPTKLLADMAAKLGAGELKLRTGEALPKATPTSDTAAKDLVNAILHGVYAQYRENGEHNAFLENVYLQTLKKRKEIPQTGEVFTTLTHRLYSLANAESLSEEGLEEIREGFAALADLNGGKPFKVYGDVEVSPADLPTLFMLSSVQHYGLATSSNSGNPFKLFDPSFLAEYAKDSKQFVRNVLNREDPALWQAYGPAFLRLDRKESLLKPRTTGDYAGGGSIVVRSAFNAGSHVEAANAIRTASNQKPVPVIASVKEAKMVQAGALDEAPGTGEAAPVETPTPAPVEHLGVTKIISGAQTGGDIGGLRAAQQLGIETGGTMPKGWRTADGAKPEYAQEFGMQEHARADYVPRTIQNVLDADATIAVLWGPSVGTSKTIGYAQTGKWQAGKAETDLAGKRPVLVITTKDAAEAAQQVREFVTATGAKSLNIAGHRERSQPGIEQFTTDMLVQALGTQQETPTQEQEPGDINIDAMYAVGYVPGTRVTGPGTMGEFGAATLFSSTVDGKPEVVYLYSESITPEDEQTARAYATANNLPIVESADEAVAPVADEALETINIYAGTGENADLSNFAERPFTHTVEVREPAGAGGIVPKTLRFPTVEHYFQFSKWNDYMHAADRSRAGYAAIVRHAQKILNAPTAAAAKRLGNARLSNTELDVWDEDSESYMRDGLRMSFQQNPKARARLLATGNATLTHTQDNSKWGEAFPRLLMEVREELRGESPETGIREQEPATPEAPAQIQEPPTDSFTVSTPDGRDIIIMKRGDQWVADNNGVRTNLTPERAAAAWEQSNEKLLQDLRALDVEVEALRERAGAQAQVMEQLFSNEKALGDANVILREEVSGLQTKVDGLAALKSFWMKVALVSLGANVLILVAGGFYVYKKVAFPWAP